MISLQKIYTHNQFTHGLSISFKKRQKIKFSNMFNLYSYYIKRRMLTNKFAVFSNIFDKKRGKYYCTKFNKKKQMSFRMKGRYFV